MAHGRRSSARPTATAISLVGLGALAALWLAWSVFGWVPVAGKLVGGAAFLVTWLLATAGLRRRAAEPRRHQGELRRPAASRPRRSPTSTSGPPRSSGCRRRAGPAAGRPRGGSDARRRHRRTSPSRSGRASAAAPEHAGVQHLPAAARRDPAAGRAGVPRRRPPGRARPARRAVPDGRLVRRGPLPPHQRLRRRHRRGRAGPRARRRGRAPGASRPVSCVRTPTSRSPPRWTSTSTSPSARWTPISSSAG